MKLNKTYIPNEFFTDFNQLPEVVKDFILRESEALTDIECSSYTVFKDTAILRHTARIDGNLYDIEMILGDVVDEDDCNFENDDEAKNYLSDLLSVIELEHVPVYLTLIEE
jgi:hypothetical protein